MENNNEILTAEQARKMDLVEYLAALGHHPKFVRNGKYWYLSPFREEKNPSFKIDHSLNVWSDFGEPAPPGKKVCGGTLIDFGIRYHHCTVGEFLHLLGRGQGLPVFSKAPAQKQEPKVPEIRILKAIPITHPALLVYLRERRIPFRIASGYCREVHYQLYGRTYFAIGFRNQEGGYELRNRNYKMSSSPKAFTHIQHGAQPASVIAVFEGFFSFLSYMTLIPETDREDTDCLVLNSLVFFEGARPLMESYKGADLFMDNNPAGKKVTAYARSLDRRHYRDKSSAYKGYDDFNSFHCHFGEVPKKRKGLSPGSSS